MSSPNSSRKNKSSFGNGSYPPHMQSSLSPQGFGLYNSNGGSSSENSTSIASCFSPPNQQTSPCKDYLISNALPHDVVNAAGGDGLWNATGNENFTTFSTSGGSRVNGLSESGYEAMRRVDGGFGGSFPKPQEQPLSHAVPTTTMHQPPYQSPPKQYATNETEPGVSQRPPANVARIRAAGALGQKDFSSGSSSINGNRGNQWVMPSMFDGENSSHETVNSSTAAPRFLPQSDLSGVSGFGISGGTNGKALVKSQLHPYYHQNNNANNTSARNSRSEDPELDRDQKKDRLIDSLSNSDMITCLPGFKKRPEQIKSVRPNWPKTFGDDKVAPHMLRSPAVPSAYSRHSPPIPNYSSNRQIDGHAYNNSATMSNQGAGGSRPCSPISRAKAAIGLAQREFSKINSFVEAEADGRKPAGAWKNMGTPFLSEPQTKSAQRQQKAQYRMDLERQILASKMRKAEEERKEKDNNDHPLGPEYAHPALTYYNPPHKIMDQGGSSTNPAATAALTKYIKEKYALDVSGANAIPAMPAYPQETGGSSTLSGRIGPLQQAKKEKALANLMKSRMHPRDQNQGSASRLPMNQLQTGGSRLHNGMMMQPGNSSRFAQQQQQSFGHTNLSKPQQPGFTQYPVPPGAYSARPTAYGVPIPMPSSSGWPMPMYPAYAQAYGQVNPYGQPIYPSANRGPVNSQQGQHQQQQQQYSQPPPSIPVQPPLQQGLHDPRSSQNPGIPSHAYQSQPQNYWQGQEKHKFAEEARVTQLPHMGQNPTNFQRREETYQADVDDDDDDDDDDDMDLVALKEKACSTQKIWQQEPSSLPAPTNKNKLLCTSDELPDPELRTAIYKAELRKQIDEDRRRKAEKQAREKEEEERIEMKIREFHEEERQRMAMEQQTRAELEGYHRSKVERKQKRHEALTIRNRNQEEKVIRRPRSRSSVLAEKLARYGPEAGDFEEPYERDNRYNNRIIRTPQSYIEDQYQNEKLLSTSLAVAIPDGSGRPVRKASPPVPVVQRKLIESFLNDPDDSRSMVVRRQPSFDGQNFLLELKSKLSSERDLVERRLREKLESTHKNMNLLKYTMNQK